MHFKWEIVCVEIRQSTPFNLYESISAFVLANTKKKKRSAQKTETRRRRDKWKRSLNPLRRQCLILLAVFMASLRITIKLTVLWRVDSSHTHVLTHICKCRQLVGLILVENVSCEEPAERKEGTGRTKPSQTKTKRNELKWNEECPRQVVCVPHKKRKTWRNSNVCSYRKKRWSFLAHCPETWKCK